MKRFLKKRDVILHESGLQDVIFLVGIFLFISIMIIVIFPGSDLGIVINREFFIYGVMTVPVIAALYFIVISFRRKRYSDTAEIGTSIRKKMALAFVFVAILPTVPIVIISSYFTHNTMSHVMLDRTTNALGNALAISKEPGITMYKGMEKELESLDYMVKKKIVNFASMTGRGMVHEMYLKKNIHTLFFLITREMRGHALLPLDPLRKLEQSKVKEFFETVSLTGPKRVDIVSFNGTPYLIGALRDSSFLTVLYEPFPEEIERRVGYYSEFLVEYQRLQGLIKNYNVRAGILFFILSIIIIAISVLVSLYLSKNITKPVLELSESAKKIAAGDFGVTIARESEDELGLLYRSFNTMVRELDRNRKTMYQKQRLEAWREMAKRLVHEIKNPLTPIRLSAERMRKRYLENHPDIKSIVLSGTETIIEEVEVLMDILSEFTKFARLPEMKPARNSINPIIEGCANVFAGLENVVFHLKLDALSEIVADKVLIRQALMNLIQNAVDAIGESGNITIISKEHSENGWCCIRIQVVDDGAGIQEGFADSIFTPGFSTKPKGTGLGLSIVEKIIIEHRGKISFSSVYGKGTEFTIDLPTAGEEGMHGKDTPRR